MPAPTSSAASAVTTIKMEAEGVLSEVQGSPKVVISIMIKPEPETMVIKPEPVAVPTAATGKQKMATWWRLSRAEVKAQILMRASDRLGRRRPVARRIEYEKLFDQVWASDVSKEEWWLSHVNEHVKGFKVTRGVRRAAVRVCQAIVDATAMDIIQSL